jgi:hypothetical protein
MGSFPNTEGRLAIISPSLGSSSSCLQLPATRLFALRNEVTIAVDLISILDQFLVRQRMRQRG